MLECVVVCSGLWRFDTLIEKATRWRRVFAQGSTLLGVLMVGCLWGALGIYSEGERAATERAAVQNSDNLARAFEEHLSRSLKMIDRSLKVARARYVRNPDSADFRNWLRDSQLFDDQTVQVAVIDADGLASMSTASDLNSAGSSSQKLSLSDREHFRVHVGATADNLFISKPVIGRASGKWSIQLTRRIENGDGSFGGVIVASLDPTYLSRFYNSVDIQGDGYIGVVGADGILRAVSGRAAMPIGADVSGATLFRYLPGTSSGWYYTEKSFVDGKAHLVTYRALSDYPLVVTIALSTAELFAADVAERRWFDLTATTLTLLILVVVGLSIRGRWLREKLADDLNTQNGRLSALLTNMPLGVCMFDDKGRLAISNDRYRQIYDLPAGAALPGTPLRDIIRYRRAKGCFSDDEAEFYGHLPERLAKNSVVAESLRLTDGRVISVLNQSVEGRGWVSIHEDTTEQQIAKLRLEQTWKFLDTVIENVPVPIVVKDADTLNFVLVNHAYEGFIGRPRDEVIGKSVFDLFGQKDAELITGLDRDAVQANKRLVMGDFPVQNPARGTRIVNTTRLVICKENSRPEYLIVVIDDVTEKKKAEAKIAHLAHHDPLTGLLNRTRFNERLGETLASVDQGRQLAVLLLDLDQFKQVNDVHGHLVGDELLKAVAERLRGCVRDVDFVARLGGDEFVIIQSEIETSADASVLADRIRAAIMAPYDLVGRQFNVGVSIGISCAPRDAVASAELMRQADVALYRAKGDGRGIYRFFEAELDAGITARREIESDLRDALARDEFELLYQPIVDIRDNEIVSLEALLRWHHPRRGTVLPAEFISAAEESGLIVPIGEWVIRQACSDAAKWPEGVRVAVNISPAQLRNQSLPQVVVGALAASGVRAGRLEFEITEEMSVEHDRDNLPVLQQLRGLGARIVMDDFGIGSSSLNNLRRFRFDKIKIDCSFANGLADGSDLSLAIVQAAARLAGALGVPAIAEGIETKEQLSLVRAAGCSEFQGYVFCPPKPVAEIARLFDTRRPAAIDAA
jgi:diguanylate cyclase (GGDEF)-like protein/PAS domain S-box-containing protein